jgi:hypothetical protein
MIIEWFDSKEAEKFGQLLAHLFIEKVPPSNEKNKNKSLAKQLEVVDKIYLKIDQFKATHKLNIYKKAKLGSAFKFELINAGYDTAFINKVTNGLMRKV